MSPCNNYPKSRNYDNAGDVRGLLCAERFDCVDPCSTSCGDDRRNHRRGQNNQGCRDEGEYARLPDLCDVPAKDARECKADHQACGHSDAGDDQPLQNNSGEYVASLRAKSHANSKLARAPTY